jgi:hypothetical protein
MKYMKKLRYSYFILVLGNRLRLVVSFTLRPHYSRRHSPLILWIGGWVGSITDLEAMERIKSYPTT